MARHHVLRTALLSLVSITACASILDIQSAKYDHRLDSDGSAGGSGNQSLCDRYCSAVQANCTGTAHEQYVSKTVCLSICEKLDPGSETDNTGNTVGCRLHYAMSAGIAGELDINCPAAGPGGNGVCGSNCDGLCKVDLQTCTGSLATYGSVAQCTSACSTVPDLAKFDAGTRVYSTAIVGGNSVQCRLYHLGAAQTDPTLHCSHVAGMGPCAP